MARGVNGTVEANQEGNHPRFCNYDDKEEATCISKLTFLRFNPCMAYFVVPILSVCTVLIFPLFLFWYPSLRIKVFYSKQPTINKATQIFVEGIKGNVEVVDLFKSDASLAIRDSFIYRFIKFEFNPIDEQFNPVIFDVKHSHRDIHEKYGDGINQADWRNI